MSVIEINELLEKVDNNTLTFAEIASLARKLQKTAHKGTPGFGNVSRDDVQWLQTYAFALKKWDLFSKGEDYDINSGGDWRQAMDDVSKLKFLIDELQDKKLVNEVAWYVDGISLFNITQPEIYKKVILNKVRTLLEKIKG
ncbi:MAG: hypothetical protein SCH39_09180 [Methanosarcinales archaeon]|nr:hypothetical protein [ANME-2 cluster archaeon]MDF1530829.1 hypothetical protein [ANME-2 cluster archaeon]MDW7776486.1 hypothetical protein [Methanosarcinales archaeon]